MSEALDGAHRAEAAICGVGQSAYGRDLGRSAVDLSAEALRNALDDAGLTPGDLDGMIVSFGSPLGADADTLAFTLGLDLRFYSQTWAHGRFTATAIQHAAMAIGAGMADVVACLGSQSFSAHTYRGRARRAGGPAFGGDGDGDRSREGGGHGEDLVVGMTARRGRPGGCKRSTLRRSYDPLRRYPTPPLPRSAEVCRLLV